MHLKERVPRAFYIRGGMENKIHDFAGKYGRSPCTEIDLINNWLNAELSVSHEAVMKKYFAGIAIEDIVVVLKKHYPEKFK